MIYLNNNIIDDIISVKKYAIINKHKNCGSVRGGKISSSSPVKIRRFRIWCNEFLCMAVSFSKCCISSVKGSYRIVPV